MIIHEVERVALLPARTRRISPMSDLVVLELPVRRSVILEGLRRRELRVCRPGMAFTRCLSV